MSGGRTVVVSVSLRDLRVSLERSHARKEKTREAEPVPRAEGSLGLRYSRVTVQQVA